MTREALIDIDVPAGPGARIAPRRPGSTGLDPKAAPDMPDPGDVVLVTGASGFVGAAVARRLSRTGCTIRTLLRSTSSRANLGGMSVDVVEGDMRDPTAIGAAMQGARYLIHAAADYRLWARDPQEILDCNERGTGVVMAAAVIRSQTMGVL